MITSVAIIGSTGSIGTQALEVIDGRRGQFSVTALAAAGTQPRELARPAIHFGVETLAVPHATAAQDVQLALYAEAQHRRWNRGDQRLPRLIPGQDAAIQVAAGSADVVLTAAAGAAGLPVTLAALEAGSRLALANKESLIIGGTLVTDKAAPGQIIPVDSEHSALAQALRGEKPGDIRRLVLTASGGPFHGYSRADLGDVTPQQALNHPTWDMGDLVTINSATLVNKGLEVIEAHLLFGIGYAKIGVVVHPTSIVHSMGEFVDGATIAQASPPDMRLPMALALARPGRVEGAAPGCDWTSATSWQLAPLGESAFPAVALARRAGSFGRTGPAVFNAANEVCVNAFLSGQLAFLGIVDTVSAVLAEHMADPVVVTRELTMDAVAEAIAGPEYAHRRLPHDHRDLPPRWWCLH